MKKFLKLAPWAMVGLAVLALLMMFLPQVKTDGGNSWDGTEIVFGTSLYGQEVLKFSFMNLFTYILVLVTAIFAIVNYMNDNKTLLIVSIISAFGAMLFFFLAKTFVAPAEEIKALVQQYCSLDIGAILGGIFSLIAGVAGITKLVLDK